MKHEPRIISLLPAATEMVYLLGLGQSLVGVSEDCDFPQVIKRIPSLTTAVLTDKLSSGQIDQRVRKLAHQGQSVFHLDQLKLQELKPDLVLSQELCSVCALPAAAVAKAAREIKSDFKTLSLESESVGDIFNNIRTVAKFTRRQKAASKSIKQLKFRLSKIKLQTQKQLNKPTVLIIEWLDPLMVAAHWVPEMVELAGGKMLIGKKGKKSEPVTWSQIIKANPDILILAPCGFSIKRTKKELGLIIKNPQFGQLTAYQSNQVYLVDGNAYLTRPGPRIVDGIEILAEIFYPRIFKRSYKQRDWQKI